jgi:hypothetical protein
METRGQDHLAFRDLSDKRQNVRKTSMIRVVDAADKVANRGSSIHNAGSTQYFWQATSAAPATAGNQGPRP